MFQPGEVLLYRLTPEVDAPPFSISSAFATSAARPFDPVRRHGELAIPRAAFDALRGVGDDPAVYPDIC